MSKKLLGELVDRWVRGEDLHFNQAQNQTFDGARTMLLVLMDENVSLDDPAIRSYLLDYMLVSPLPRGLGPWPKSDAEKQCEAELKAEANCLYKQRRRDFHETEDADTSWKWVVGELKRLHRDDALKTKALEVKPIIGREREDWKVLRNRWYGR